MLTNDRLKEVIHYDPETGHFTWLQSACRFVIGRRAGSLDMEGYRRMSVLKHFYKAHRLAWFYVHGVWPKHTIDHIDGDRDNNAITNLRDVPHGINLQNVHARRNSTGFRGVSKIKSGWSSSIGYRKQVYHLGVFSTPEEAHAAYLAATQTFHGAEHGK